MTSSLHQCFDAFSWLDTRTTDADLTTALQSVRAAASSNGASSIESSVERWDYELDKDPAPSVLRDDHFKQVSQPSRSTAAPRATDWLHANLPAELVESALAIVLRSTETADRIAENLLELYGFERVELVGETMNRRSQLIAEHEAAHKKSATSRDDFSSRPHTPLPVPVPPPPPRDHLPQAQVTFQTAAELAAAKKAKKTMQRHLHKGRHGRGDGEDGGLDETALEEWERIRMEQLAQGPGPMVSGERQIYEQERYPNVYLAPGSTGATLGMGGQRLMLPVGTTREDKGSYEEIMIPAPKAVPFRFDESLIPISSMDAWGQRTFHAYKSLNRLQSIVFPVAHGTNENMLVCAPTGAGKTDVALLTILRCLASLTSTPLHGNAKPTLPPASTYKIIYVAPLKALAAEITAKFAKRLSWAGVKCRELTGDMKLTKKEVDETGVIVTTPEKWDVVTRKGAGAGDGDVADKVKLLIIDEVHLLHEDRGAVIESIVARTLRQVESSQTLIRIIGLSATLPNYVDVADFLRVNRYQGLFYFDASFRPVPLEQHFLGVKGKPGTPQSRASLDNAAFDKVAELLKAGHQVMVFVHARKDTVKTAQTLREKAQEDGNELIDILDNADHDKMGSFKRDLAASRNREMKELATQGFGIHHAGMLRSDRNITERMFEANLTKVLCCTATLAWGVNLPAYAVVIKGTQVYDAGKGCFVDLGILDVLQIFGRAGRPQYEDQGVGYICTTYDKMDHYVSAITQQHAIESKFVAGLVDSLNAEISLGTVSNMDEGVRWLGYSYLFVRMRKNPLVYGMTVDDVMQDPLLGSKRMALMNNSVKRLVETQMIKYDAEAGALTSTDLGRVASKYYIRSASIEIFNKLFRPRMSEADVLSLLAASTEFEQIAVRENEVPELSKLIETVCPCQVKGGTDSSAGKVNVLLQAYISRAYIDDFALVSDTGYVAQNAGRIVRALLEIAMAKRWAPVTLVLTSMSKAIEKRMWPFNHPLGQFDLPADLVYNIERWADDLPLHEVAAMSPADFGTLIKQNERLGERAVRAAKQMPGLELKYTLQPVAHDLIRIRLEMRKAFEWSEKLHGAIEAFWVWIEDEEGMTILQISRVIVRPTTRSIVQEFTVPVTGRPKQLFARIVSDRWMGSEDFHEIGLEHVVMPPTPPAHLPLLELPLLSTRDAFSKLPAAQHVYAQTLPTLDPIQTQAFHTAHHSSANALLCAPSAQSRGILLESAIWRALSIDHSSRILFITPRRALARQVALRLRRTLSSSLSATTTLVTHARDLNGDPPAGPIIIVSDPKPLLRHVLEDPAQLGSFNLILAHDIHALDTSYELLLSRLRHAVPSTRVVASSASLLDPTAAAEWLSVPELNVYNFSPTTRTSAVTTSFQSFSAPHSSALLRSMVKPAYTAMRTARGSTICFVPSRGQCRATAMELVTHSATDLEESFIDGSLDAVEAYAQSMSDPDLAEALTHGIAVFHEGLQPQEQRVALELFSSGAVRVLVTSREACWTLPLSASLVIVMSAQYAARTDPDAPNHEREIKDYRLSEIVQMQSLATPPSAEASAELLVLCQPDQAEFYKRFLDQGLPLESELALDPLLADTLVSDLAEGKIRSHQDVVDMLSWTLAYQRVKVNPSFYGERSTNDDADGNDEVSRFADQLLAQLEAHCCLLFSGTKFALSVLGRLVARRAFALSDLYRLQQLDIEELVSRSGKAGGRTTNGHAITPSESAGKSLDVTDPLQAFHQRLPRAVKDVIGDEGPETESYRKRVLLAAFAAGRVPRGTGGLEQEQAALVKRLLESQHAV